VVYGIVFFAVSGILFMISVITVTVSEILCSVSVISLTFPEYFYYPHKQ
jgi:hypothetical protein